MSKSSEALGIRAILKPVIPKYMLHLIQGFSQLPIHREQYGKHQEYMYI